VIISTGIAELRDIELAIATCKEEGNKQVVLLHCTSEYPAAPENANLKNIPDLITRFGLEVGLSDHTMGIEAPVIAAALGATVIEKHFILDKKIGGPDAHFSLDEKEFGELVKAVRTTEKMLGKAGYEMSDKKKKSREFSRSLFVADDIKAGELFTEKNVRSVRPAYGMHPRYFEIIIGKRASRDLVKGTPLQQEMISGFKDLAK
jgi:pseudaminic acid synthase